MAKSSIDFERVFRSFDKDGDGKISAAELQQCMRAMGQDLDAGEVEVLAELEESGLLGFEELAKLAGMGEVNEEKKTNEVRQAYDVFKMEGEGFITAESLKQMLGKLGAPRDTEECKGMIRGFDLVFHTHETGRKYGTISSSRKANSIL